MSQPASQRAEESVLGAILLDEEVRMEVMASLLEPEHFHFAPYREVYEEIVERYYADDTIDALLVAEARAPRLAKLWKCEEREAVDRVLALTTFDEKTSGGSVSEHAAIIKRHADYRSLLALVKRTERAILEEARDPDVLAGELSTGATRVATSALSKLEVLSHLTAGRRWVEMTKMEIAARESGRELGAFFGIRGIDSVTKGLRPTELMILGGEPGMGKSTVAWAMARNFAKRQLQTRDTLPAGQQMIGTLVLSMEMGESPSGTRIAQASSGIDGEKLRMGTLTRAELREAAYGWAKEKEWPLYWLYSGELRETQIRAIVVDAVRRFNVGLVIIDHFKFINTDERFGSANEADDQIVKFLKSGLAKDLNLAVVCLAHTTKSIERADKRPRMGDLRGSGMISAFADFVSFIFHPWSYATTAEQEKGLIARDEYEVIFDKSRHSAKRTGEIWIDLPRMVVR